MHTYNVYNVYWSRGLREGVQVRDAGHVTSQVTYETDAIGTGRARAQRGT